MSNKIDHGSFNGQYSLGQSSIREGHSCYICVYCLLKILLCAVVPGRSVHKEIFALFSLLCMFYLGVLVLENVASIYEFLLYSSAYRQR